MSVLSPSCMRSVACLMMCNQTHLVPHPYVITDVCRAVTMTRFQTSNIAYLGGMLRQDANKMVINLGSQASGSVTLG